MAIITGQATLSVTPFAVPSPTVGDTAALSLSIAGGIAPYTVRVVSGQLPAGLSLNGSTISGTYSKAGASLFVITVADLAGSIASFAFAITVLAASTVPSAILTFSNLSPLQFSDAANLELSS